jgi:hypothetical protein
MKKAKSILVISDLHCPYEHPDAVRFLAACKAKFKPTDVICIGDEADFHALSYHESNPDLSAAGDELNKAIDALRPIYKLFPRCTVIESNHGSMVLRKALTGGIPQKALKGYNEVLEAPKSWRWVDAIILQTELGPVYFCHGKSGSPGKMASQYGMSVVQGHFHEKSQVCYISTPERLMFDLHTGCLANDKSLALQYNKINPKRPIVSIAVILNGVPQIVPMVLNKNYRWVGKL